MSKPDQTTQHDDLDSSIGRLENGVEIAAAVGALVMTLAVVTFVFGSAFIQVLQS